MASDIPTISGTLGGESFQFYIDGVSTYDQMDKLLDRVDLLIKRFKAGEVEDRKLKEEKKKETELIKATNELREQENDDKKKALQLQRDLGQLTNLTSRGFDGLLQSIDNTTSGLVGLGFVVGSLTGLTRNLLNYSTFVGGALQMGISGGVMDFAIASKTAGLGMADFTKALKATDGGFAALGNNATDGAKQFGLLVKEVRTATGAFGNLGLSNDQLAELTAQQVKVAVGQGMKGRQAQDFVIRNTRELGAELEDLASKTGKSVVDLAQAAMKVSMNPVIASFVKEAGAYGGKIATSAQKFVSSFTAIYGEKGSKIAEDALQAAFSGLPFIISKTGQDLYTISSNVATEVERQSQIVAQGGKVSEQDRERLRQMVLAETKARGQELRQLASMPGPLQQTANELLKMSQDAEFYNSKEGKERRKQEESAKKFVEESNKLKATLMELTIPFLELLNNINWVAMFKVLNGFATAVGALLTPISYLGKWLGDTGVGSLLGGLMGVAFVVGGTVLAFKNLAAIVGLLASVFTAATTIFGKTAAGRVAEKAVEALGNKPTSISDIFKSKAQEVGISAGYGTSPAKPLYVVVLGGRGSGTGLPGGAPGGAGEKPRYKYDPKTGKPVLIEPTAEPAGKSAVPGRGVLNWLKSNSTLVLSIFGGIAGAAIRSSGEKDLEENPDSTKGKIKEIAGTALEWGAILGGLASFSDQLKSLGSSALDVAKNSMPKLKELGSTALDFSKTFSKSVVQKIPLIGGLIGGLFEYSDSGNIGRSIFSALGAAAGSAGGGLLGSLIAPGAGTIVGGVAGGFAGEKAATSLYDWLFGSNNSNAAMPGFSAAGESVQRAQSSAIDQEKLRMADAQSSNSKMIEILEEIRSANEASLGIQAKGVGVADSSNKILRDQSMRGWSPSAA